MHAIGEYVRHDAPRSATPLLPPSPHVNGHPGM
ncbi:hypothetical protein HNP84_001144 [Thermocatellispora tengchongensis]|uniref:Uncharacterized protein n=1 Tax=Thermocatellispora tengchongensis TaxID=1073253 RepID=A0A840NV78_9ACTN|nr:hypothetical protein [Thermocatellispora tengchongensis]